MTLERPGLDYEKSVGPSNLRQDVVEAYAEEVASTAEFEIGSSLVALAEDKLRGRVHFLDLDEWDSETGSIYVHAQWDFDIVLPRYTSARRDQFTIGHELGHYFLHSNQGERPIIATRNAMNERVEWEANWFAAALLMPAKQFNEAWQSLGSPDLVAAMFAVSTSAAEVRGKVLGLHGD